MAETKNPTTDRSSAAVAGPAENRKLEHSQGGVSTRDDVLDLGVPMLPGDPAERVGPEDALGEGPKRGDYTGRVGPSFYQPHTVEPVPDAKPGEPIVRVIPQRPLTEDIGDMPRRKGGVDTGERR